MIVGPDSKYMMQWSGEWRAVTNLFDHNGNPTIWAMRAAKAVLFVADGYWVSCVVQPGDLIERLDRDPNIRDWDYVR
jgi:hypothetical protein